MHSVFFIIHPADTMMWDTSMTVDAAMWNGSVGELSSCVINNIPLDHVL